MKNITLKLRKSIFAGMVVAMALVGLATAGFAGAAKASAGPLDGLLGFFGVDINPQAEGPSCVTGVNTPSAPKYYIGGAVWELIGYKTAGQSVCGVTGQYGDDEALLLLANDPRNNGNTVAFGTFGTEVTGAAALSQYGVGLKRPFKEGGYSAGTTNESDFNYYSTSSYKELNTQAAQYFPNALAKTYGDTGSTTTEQAVGATCYNAVGDTVLSGDTGISTCRGNATDLSNGINGDKVSDQKLSGLSTYQAMQLHKDLRIYNQVNPSSGHKDEPAYCNTEVDGCGQWWTISPGKSYDHGTTNTNAACSIVYGFNETVFPEGEWCSSGDVALRPTIYMGIGNTAGKISLTAAPATSITVGNLKWNIIGANPYTGAVTTSATNVFYPNLPQMGTTANSFTAVLAPESVATSENDSVLRALDITSVYGSATTTAAAIFETKSEQGQSHFGPKALTTIKAGTVALTNDLFTETEAKAVCGTDPDTGAIKSSCSSLAFSAGDYFVNGGTVTAAGAFSSATTDSKIARPTIEILTSAVTPLIPTNGATGVTTTLGQKGLKYGASTTFTTAFSGTAPSSFEVTSSAPSKAYIDSETKALATATVTAEESNATGPTNICVEDAVGKFYSCKRVSVFNVTLNDGTEAIVKTITFPGLSNALVDSTGLIEPTRWTEDGLAELEVYSDDEYGYELSATLTTAPKCTASGRDIIIGQTAGSSYLEPNTWGYKFNNLNYGQLGSGNDGTYLPANSIFAVGTKKTLITTTSIPENNTITHSFAINYRPGFGMGNCTSITGEIKVEAVGKVG